jgi:hypothetical protein
LKVFQAGNLTRDHFDALTAKNYNRPAKPQTRRWKKTKRQGWKREQQQSMPKQELEKLRKRWH